MKILSLLLFLMPVCIQLVAQDFPVKIPPGVEEIFMDVEEMPVFPGCDIKESSHDEKMDCTKKEIASFIVNNLKYPEKAKKENIQGKVITSFIINTDGTMDRIVIMKDIGGNCGEAAKQVLIAMSDLEPWTPGRQHGKTVSVFYTLPFTFKL